jgi:hypothetical protein
MSDFLRSCVERYIELTGGKYKLKYAATPFLDEKAAHWELNGGKGIPPEDYSNFPSRNRRRVATPMNATMNITEWEPDPELEDTQKITPTGALQPIASKIVMKVLYAARMCRWDLLRVCGVLSQKVSKWTELEDKMLHRMMCYINSTIDLKMIGWVGQDITIDDPADHVIYVYSDADFAGSVDNTKSTTGCFTRVTGTTTSFPLCAFSKKQTSTALSTPEAEIVAAAFCCNRQITPGFTLWKTTLGREPTIRFMEDNETCICIIKSGKSPALRHIMRTQRISIGSLHEAYSRGDFEIRYCDTEEQSADIFTKAFTCSNKWTHATGLINHVYPNEFWKEYGTPGY